MITVVEDRVLARVALEAVGWNHGGDPTVLADVALGQAVVALRVLGIATTPEVTRAVTADIADIMADPELIARAMAIGTRVDTRAPGGRLAA